MSRTRLVLLGVLVFLVGTLYHLPAALVLPRVLPAAAPATLYGLDGRLLDGAADEARIGGHSLGALDWDLQLSQILRGRMSARIEARGEGRLRGRVWIAADGSWGLDEMEAASGLAALTSLLPGLPAEVDGRLSGQDLSLEVVDGFPVAASGVLRLDGLRAAAPMDLALGDHIAELETLPEGQIRARIRDRSGPVAVSGHVDLDAMGGWTMDLNLNPRPDAPQAIREGLRFLGTPNPDGGVRIQRRGTLPPLG